LFKFDPEIAHNLSITALKTGLVGASGQLDDPILKCRVWGLDFTNPIGMAAGYDKEAEVADPLLKLGFGFVETGTVTPLPQPGNPKPRLFRLQEDMAVINRFGFNSGGLEGYANRLKLRRKNPQQLGIIGANVGKNKDTVDGAADFVTGIKAVCNHADYLVVNVSSPNTAGLRDMQARDQLEGLFCRVLEARQSSMENSDHLPPLLVKVAPDLNEQERKDIAEVVVSSRMDGIIVGNTTISRPETLISSNKGETGGLSGKPLMELSTFVLADFYRLTEGKVPLIGCGGVTCGSDAYQKIINGASLVQFYSAMVYQGPGMAKRVAQELAECLREGGYSSVEEAVGVAVS